jgi:hypothetical protein
LTAATIARIQLPRDSAADVSVLDRIYPMRDHSFAARSVDVELMKVCW